MRGLYGQPIDRLPAEGVVFAPCAAAALYNAAVFREVNGFDVNFFCYCEDIDLAFRIHLLGGRCIYVKDAVVYHGGSVITGRRSEFTMYYGTRNRIWTYFKNMPGPLLLMTFAPHLLLTLVLIVREYLHNGAWKAMVKGSLDGVLGFWDLCRVRRELQTKRVVSSLKVARGLTWSFIKLIRRDHDVRPIRD